MTLCKLVYCLFILLAVFSEQTICEKTNDAEKPPVISSEWKAFGGLKWVVFPAQNYTQKVYSRFFSSAKHSAARQDFRVYFPGFPDEAALNPTTTSEYVHYIEDSGKIPSGYENATWYPVDSVTITDSLGEFQIMNGVCRHRPFTRADPLAIMPYTSYNGVAMIGDDKCEEWIYVSPTYNSSIYVLANNVSIVRRFTGVTKNNYLAYDFHSFIPDVNYTGTDLFDVPDSCTPPGAICEGEGVQELEMVRFHAPNAFSMEDDNSADYIGDAYFICLSLAQDIEPTYEWVSKYFVSVDTAWGNYALCNYGRCWGLNHFNVGRESAGGIQDFGGQCLPDGIFGKWYSLTSEGHCSQGEKIGTDNCTWKEIERVSTIEVQCLLDRGILQACKEDKGFPFPKATEILKEGLQTCPPPDDLNPSLFPSYERSQGSNFHRFYSKINPFISLHELLPSLSENGLVDV